MIYPAQYPLPDFGSYRGTVANGVIRTGFPSPVPSQIETFNSAAIQITMTFKMDTATYTSWEAWVTANAYDFFDMPVISPHMPEDITSTSRIRFISDRVYSLLGHNWQSITVTGELIPNDPSLPPFATIVYPNFIIAGTPAAPATDDIRAGTPGAPATDIINAEIYVYDNV